MATKPTKRILDWASGGSTTDPGAGKEATGWVASERPPANWWNWILQSFGDWLSWHDDLTPVSVFRVTTDTASSTPTVEAVSGVAPDGSHQQLATGKGDTGGKIRISWSTAVFATPPKVVQITPWWDTSEDIRAFPMMVDSATDDIEFLVMDTSGTPIDFDDLTVDQLYNVTIYGTLA